MVEAAATTTPNFSIFWGFSKPGSRGETIILGFADHFAVLPTEIYKKGRETTAEYFTSLDFVVWTFSLPSIVGRGTYYFIPIEL